MTGELCSLCQQATLPQKLAQDTISVSYCTLCKKFSSGRKKVATRKLADVLIRYLKPSFPNLSIASLDISTFHAPHPGISHDITITVRHDGRTYDLSAVIDATTCTSCGRSRTEYFEGVLQLRSADDEAVRLVRTELHKIRGCQISKEKLYDAGADFFVSNQAALLPIAKKLQRKYGGVLKTSARLYGLDRQRSKDIHRVTVMLTLPMMKRHDVIEREGNVIKIIEVGRAIRGVDLQANTRVTIHASEKVIVIPAKKTAVSKVHPQLEILEPGTYQSVPVGPYHGEKLKQGQNVKAVYAKGRWWIV